jgi:hypothetical protein
MQAGPVAEALASLSCGRKLSLRAGTKNRWAEPGTFDRC